MISQYLDGVGWTGVPSYTTVLKEAIVSNHKAAPPSRCSQDSRATKHKWSVQRVAVAGDPTNIGATKEDIVVCVDVKHVLG